MWLVFRGASARIYHRPSAWLELRERRCSNSLVLEKRPSQRRRHLRKHRAFPGDCLVVWSWRPVVLASAQAGSENCGRPNYARPRRYLRARSLFHGCAPGFAMSAVSVIIPALNEEEPIGGVVRECLATKIPSEIIVVDNGSDDRTPDRAREAGAKVVSEPRHGYGRACLAGIRALKRECEIVEFLDGDGSDCPELMNRLVDPIAAGTYDFVIGSRTPGQRAASSM